jgi:hypothetical protein
MAQVSASGSDRLQIGRLRSPIDGLIDSGRTADSGMAAAVDNR